MSNRVGVGDLIWIIDAERHSVIPARVNEQIVSKTISGEKTYHHIEFPSGKTQRLENLSQTWYSDLAGVRGHLLQRAKDVIEKTVQSAKDHAQRKFQMSFEDDGFDNADVDLSKEMSDAVSPNDTAGPQDSVKVSLDNGQVVNVKVPQEFLDENFSS